MQSFDAQGSSFYALQPLKSFVDSVENGRKDQLVGIYAPNVMAIQVVQQPLWDDLFVSTKTNVLTQFRMASKYGSVGILAHNTKSGVYFYNFKIGDRVLIIYGDGSAYIFMVDQIQQYQALSSRPPYYSFVDLTNPDIELTNAEIFYRTYGLGNVLVFQTCLSKDGNDSWGLTFVIAHPLIRNYYKIYAHGKVSGKIIR